VLPLPACKLRIASTEKKRKTRHWLKYFLRKAPKPEAIYVKDQLAKSYYILMILIELSTCKAVFKHVKTN
jgi:hypothetical protein